MADSFILLFSVQVDEAKIECKNPELWRLLHLSTEDLRFADYLVRHVQDEKHDVFLDGVGWEGGDEWIRSQFKSYLLCLLRTSLLPGNPPFKSQNIIIWNTNKVGTDTLSNKPLPPSPYMPLTAVVKG